MKRLRLLLPSFIAFNLLFASFELRAEPKNTLTLRQALRLTLSFLIPSTSEPFFPISTPVYGQSLNLTMGQIDLGDKILDAENNYSSITDFLVPRNRKGQELESTFVRTLRFFDKKGNLLIESSLGHLLLTNKTTYSYAKDLKEGDSLMHLNGSKVMIGSIKRHVSK